MTTKLSIRQAKFVQEFIKHGVAERAAIEAGYSRNTAHAQTTRLLANAKVKAEIDRISRKVESTAIADAVERKEFWTAVLRNGASDMKDRLKASELLGKTDGDFLDRVESSGELVVRVVRDDA